MRLAAGSCSPPGGRDQSSPPVIGHATDARQGPGCLPSIRWPIPGHAERGDEMTRLRTGLQQAPVWLYLPLTLIWATARPAPAEVPSEALSFRLLAPHDQELATGSK